MLLCCIVWCAEAWRYVVGRGVAWCVFQVGSADFLPGVLLQETPLHTAPLATHWSWNTPQEGTTLKHCLHVWHPSADTPPPTHT
jgi:hypothetical protein